MSGTTQPEHFWQELALHEMSTDQWESLCDGCGKCCLQKLEDEETGDIYYTSVVCHYMGPNCQCSVYERRLEKVPGCLSLRPFDLPDMTWLPVTCAYRRLYEGKALPDWHPLLTGTPATARTSGNSVQQWPLTADSAVPQSEWEDYIIFKVN